MSETLQPLTVRNFIDKYLSDENLFDFIPEFSFIKSVASKVKLQNCFCGLGEELNRTTLVFNDFVDNLSEETVSKIRVLFGNEKVCFSIQNQSSWSVRCY